MSLTAQEWLKKIHALPLAGRPGRVRIMNVCGGHERSITMAGIRSALPRSIELIAGPGCPVCVCPEEDVYQAIQLALHANVILIAFGDMLRVPVNVPKREVRSLEQAKASGADVRPIASPREAVAIARGKSTAEGGFFCRRGRDDHGTGRGNAAGGGTRESVCPVVRAAHMASGRDAA